MCLLLHLYRLLCNSGDGQDGLGCAAVKSSPHILGGLQGQNSCLGVSCSFRVRDGGLCSTSSSVRILLLAPPSGTLLAPPSGTLLADVLGGEKQKLVLAPCLLPAVMGVTCIQFIVQPNAMGCENTIFLWVRKEREMDIGTCGNICPRGHRGRKIRSRKMVPKPLRNTRHLRTVKVLKSY